MHLLSTEKVTVVSHVSSLFGSIILYWLECKWTFTHFSWCGSFHFPLLSYISLVAPAMLETTMSWLMDSICISFPTRDLCSFNRLFRETEPFHSSGAKKKENPARAKTNKLSKHCLFKIQKVLAAMLFSLSRSRSPEALDSRVVSV